MSSYDAILGQVGFGEDQYNFTNLPDNEVEADPISGIFTLTYAFLTSTTVSTVDAGYSTNTLTNYYTDTTGNFVGHIDGDVPSDALLTARLIMKDSLGSSSYSVYFGDVAKIVFEIDDSSDPHVDIAIGMMDNAIGSPYFDGSKSNHVAATETRVAAEGQGVFGDIWLNADTNQVDWNDVNPGDGAFWTILHELGHSLGLKHPDDSLHGVTTPAITDDRYSIMSTTFWYGANGMSGVHVSGLQLEDIAAIQSIYGINYTTRSTNTTYGVGQGFGATAATKFIYTIWDGGGTDTIDASGYADHVIIDLRQGQFSSIGMADAGYGGARDTGLADQNVAVAYYAVLEQAIGTNDSDAGDGDIIIGNAWNNTIWGRAGDDRLYGDGMATAGATDVASAGDAGFNATASGDSGADILYGEAGNDTLYGGSGADTLVGGIGDDTYDVENAGDVVTENVGEGTDTVQTIFTASLASDFSNIENLTLTGAGNINGTGNSGNNVLKGNSGINTLNGNDGDDTFIGSAGNDTLDGGVGTDTADYSSLASTATIACTPTTSTFNKGTSGTDTLISIEKIIGSATVGCTFLGANGVIDGVGPSLQFRGGTGDDTYVFVVGTDYGKVSIDDAGGSNDNVRIDNVSTFSINLAGFNSVTYLQVHLNHGVLNEIYPQIWLNKTEINLGASIDVVQMGAVLFNTNAFVNAAADSYTVESMADLIGCRMEGDVEANLLLGFASSDTLNGYAGMDTLNGNGGADTLAGGTGDDTYLVDNVGDVLIENPGEGIDQVYSTISWTLGNNLENLSLTGTGNVNATGNADSNILIGNSGANTLDGGAGADTMTGNAGDDTFVVDDVGDVVIENSGGGTDAVVSSVDWTLGDHFEHLTLSGAAVIGTGNGLDNILTGNNGVNTLAGGAGNDTYFVDNNLDVVIENSGEGTDLVYSSASFATSANIEVIILTGSANVDASGNGLNNTITGNSGINTIDGGAGADTMAGGAGDDVYILDDAGDVVTEQSGEGTDTVQSSLSYTLSADMEHLILTGVSNTNGTGNSVDNIITGSDGNNTLNGGSGSDTLLGGLGDDTYIVDTTAEAITESVGEGIDTVQSSVSFSLSANVEILALTGTGSINGTGNSVSNTITGNSGNNTLDGGDGTDTLIGGSGNDTYIVDTTTDTITEVFGQGTDTVRSSVSFSLATVTEVENLTLTGTASIAGTGNSLVNNLTGNSGNNTLDGGNGNDTLNGGSGTDTLLGGQGNDTYIVDTTTDTITESSGQGTDTVQSSVTFSLTAIANVENLTLSGTSSINGTGNGSANTIIGNSANNTLVGGEGNDSLWGNGGMDTLIGGTGDDTYTVDSPLNSPVIIENSGEGVDTVRYTSTSGYTLPDNVENLTFAGITSTSGTGNSLDNLIIGDSNVNTLSGNDGNDTLDGWVGADTLIGGAGNDTFIVDNASDTVIEISGEGTDLVESNRTWTLGNNLENLTLQAGIPNLNGTGNALDNVITGNEGINTLTGAGGNDTLNGGAGADSFLGGTGDDVYVVDTASDIVTENASEGIDLVQSSVTWTLGNEVENLALTGSSSLNGTGNSLDNVITGNGGLNTLTGAGGNDTLDGAAGADTMIGGIGNDIFTVDNASDVVIENASEGTDLVHSAVTFSLASSNIENLTLTGFSHINGTGDGAINILTGNSGNNTLDGAAGADTMIGGAGDDLFIVDNSSDLATENASEGIDLVQASASFTLSSNIENLTLTGSLNINGTGNASANVITGNSGVNTLNGSDGNDTLVGADGNDSLSGGNANDTLDGGSGIDTMIGGAGDDTYLIEGADVLTEGASAGTDVVQSSVSWTLGANFENLTLTGANAIVGTGNSLANVITGNGAGSTLAGSTGNDTYYVGAGDVVSEGSGAGTDLVYSALSFTLTANVEQLTLTGTGDIDGTGNTLVNILTGNSGNNSLDGGTAADTMIGGLGDDTYVINVTTDVITENASEGTDSVIANVTGYTLAANVENLTLGGTVVTGTGNSLDNYLQGNNSANTLNGGSGHDILYGGAGNDRLVGGTGDDLYFVDASSDICIESVNEGADVVYASATFTLGANIETLVLTGSTAINGTGNSGANNISGNSGNNLINGGGGNDVLAGANGLDSLTGGLGVDTFFFERNTAFNNIDVITDFDVATDDDVLDLSDLLWQFDPLTAAIADFVQIVDNGANSTVSVDRDGTGIDYGFTQIATLNGITGLTDEAALVSSGNLVVA